MITEATQQIGYVDHVYICRKCGEQFHANGYTPMEHQICRECRDKMEKKPTTEKLQSVIDDIKDEMKSLNIEIERREDSVYTLQRHYDELSERCDRLNEILSEF